MKVGRRHHDSLQALPLLAWLKSICSHVLLTSSPHHHTRRSLELPPCHAGLCRPCVSPAMESLSTSPASVSVGKGAGGCCNTLLQCVLPRYPWQWNLGHLCQGEFQLCTRNDGELWGISATRYLNRPWLSPKRGGRTGAILAAPGDRSWTDSAGALKFSHS